MLLAGIELLAIALAALFFALAVFALLLYHASNRYTGKFDESNERIHEVNYYLNEFTKKALALKDKLANAVTPAQLERRLLHATSKAEGEQKKKMEKILVRQRNKKNN